MVGPADNPFKGLATAVGAINLRLFIRAHKELFEDAATLETPEFKDWHFYSPEIKVSLIFQEGINVKYGQPSPFANGTPMVFCGKSKMIRI
jgi:hypothetical protein